jgi:hypothetical protein
MPTRFLETTLLEVLVVWLHGRQFGNLVSRAGPPSLAARGRQRVTQEARAPLALLKAVFFKGGHARGLAHGQALGVPLLRSTQ